MSFDLETLRETVSRNGPVARVVIVDVRGSAPRDTGAAMLVWESGQTGTIGGGALEFEATEFAREVLRNGTTRLDQRSLGPALGQCCGGAVTLLTERWDTNTLAKLGDGPVARPVTGQTPIPMSVSRLLKAARGEGSELAPQLLDGWMIEPLARARRAVWIYGAGHVGRSVVNVLAPLPNFSITWADTGPERFPTNPKPGVTILPATDLALAATHAPENAEHFILTYSHALDLELCHTILSHSFAFCGLIGSQTKWARFTSRLKALGHSPEQIARITCPIGDPALGKHPQAIALGVGASLLAHRTEHVKEARA